MRDILEAIGAITGGVWGFILSFFEPDELEKRAEEHLEKRGDTFDKINKIRVKNGKEGDYRG